MSKISAISKNNNVKNIDITNFISFDIVLLSIIGFLISKAMIIGNLSPLSLAFFAGNIKIYKHKICVFISCIIGILLSSNSSLNIIKYILAMSIFMVISDRIKNIDSKLKLSSVVTLIILPISLFQIILSKMYLYDVLIYILEIALVFIFTYIFIFGIDMITNINNKILVRVEEAISISFIIIFSIMGIGDISLFGISLKGVLSNLFVILSSIIGGATIGCSSGAIVGLTFMINTISSPIYVGIYSLSSLIAGAFNKLNRLFCVIGYLFTYIITYIYTSGDNIKFENIVDILVASFLVMLIPSDFIKKLQGFVNINQGNNQVVNDYIKRNTDVINNKLVKVYQTYDELAKTFDKVREKDKIIDNRDVANIIDMIYKDECSVCSMKRKCWEIKFNYTYNLMYKMLEKLEEKGQIDVHLVDDDFRKECLRPEQISKVASYYYRMFVLDYNWSVKFSESRRIIANQIKSISKSIETISNDLNENILVNIEKEKEIYDELKRNNISLNNVSYTQISKNEFEISIEKSNCINYKLCDEKIVNLLSNFTGEELYAQKIGCHSLSGKCRINLRKSQKYKATTQVAKMSKDGNIICGDNYTYMDIGDGKYMVAVSDGMGKGKKAYEESYITIDILEKMMESGIDDNIVINTINNMLLLKSNTEEMFSTIDLGIFDLKRGSLETVKMGACPTYIKRSDEDVDLISSSSLPVGILSDIKLDRKSIKVSKGDFIIMLSDGILDAGKNKKLGDNWLIYFLKQIKSTNPKDIANEILDKSLELQDGKVEDDMTVIVTKICD